jgi:hypothetical protein
MNQQLIKPAAEVKQPTKFKIKNTRALIFLALYAFMVHAYDRDNYVYTTCLSQATRVIQNSQTDYKPIT